MNSHVVSQLSFGRDELFITNVFVKFRLAES